MWTNSCGILDSVLSRNERIAMIYVFCRFAKLTGEPVNVSEFDSFYLPYLEVVDYMLNYTLSRNNNDSLESICVSYLLTRASAHSSRT